MTAKEARAIARFTAQVDETKMSWVDGLVYRCLRQIARSTVCGEVHIHKKLIGKDAANPEQLYLVVEKLESFGYKVVSSSHQLTIGWGD